MSATTKEAIEGVILSNKILHKNFLTIPQNMIFNLNTVNNYNITNKLVDLLNIQLSNINSQFEFAKEILTK